MLAVLLIVFLVAGIVFLAPRLKGLMLVCLTLMLGGFVCLGIVALAMSDPTEFAFYMGFAR